MEILNLIHLLKILQKKLYDFRLKRTPPFKDKKNLAFVNGLMIATLSMGANILKKREYIEKAEEIGEFIINKLIKKWKTIY